MGVPLDDTQLERQRRDWDDLAALDPYWAVLTRPGKRFGGWDGAEFFATGTTEADSLMERAARLAHPRERRRALDFGCGLGRVTRALARHFDTCVGVDISEDMLAGARRANATVEGVSFVRAGDLSRFPDREFDLVYSTIVLQHVPDRSAIGAYIAEFCRVLRPDGLIAFQLPSHIPAIYRLQWQRRLYSVLRRLGVGAPFLYRRLRLQPMAMSFVPEPAVVRLLNSLGARVLDVETESAAVASGMKLTSYYATRSHALS